MLACVFVRFMEDNDLIDECWLAGEGERRKLAEDTHELFFRKHPHDTDREYFQHVFNEVGKIPAAKELFAEGKTPLWAVAPSGDAAMKLLEFWREIDAETGHLKRSFEVENGDTRFLGDLYQELSERARKKYALLQTPVFVEEFILDRTLTPAIDEFGLEKVRMIDPTCGSGHFLLGAFARLFDLWSQRESNEIVAAQKALDGVWGVDINPFAVAIARFRLIVAAVQACGIKRLKQAPGWNIHLATGDSLLFGSRWNVLATRSDSRHGSPPTREAGLPKSMPVKIRMPSKKYWASSTMPWSGIHHIDWRQLHFPSTTITIPAPNDLGFDSEPPYSKEAHHGAGHGSTGTSAADVLDGWEVGQGRGMEQTWTRRPRGSIETSESSPRSWMSGHEHGNAGGFLRGRLGGGAREAGAQSRAAGPHPLRLAPTTLPGSVPRRSVADASTSDSSMASRRRAAQGGVLHSDPLSRPSRRLRLYPHDEPQRDPGRSIL